MSKIQQIIDVEVGRSVDPSNPVFEAQHRNVAMLMAMDVLVDKLDDIDTRLDRIDNHMPSQQGR
jgi:hypothetical protein